MLSNINRYNLYNKIIMSHLLAIKGAKIAVKAGKSSIGVYKEHKETGKISTTPVSLNLNICKVT